MNEDYRSRIYERYDTNFQDATKIFKEGAAWRWGRAYLFYMREWLQEDKRANIVDLACGWGRLLYFFRSMGYQNVTGVDISPEQQKDGTVEPVFANIRHTLGMDRFTLRSRTKVDIQWKLFFMVHNIGKISRYAAV